MNIERVNIHILTNFFWNQFGDASSIQLCLSLLKKPGACLFMWKKFSSCSCLCFEGFSPDMLVFLCLKISTNNKIEESFKWAGIRDLMPYCKRLARLLLVSCSVLTISSTTKTNLHNYCICNNGIWPFALISLKVNYSLFSPKFVL